MKVKEESENAALNLNIQKTKMTSSGPITSWQIDGETMETVTDFILGGSKINADGDCSHEIKRRLLLGRKFMTNLDNILKKQRHYFANKCPSSKPMVFPVVRYEYESWTIKKAEHWRIDAFELWCRRTLFRVPLTARRSDQSILKEISHKYSLKALILKLKLQYFGHLMRRINSFEKTTDTGKDWRQEEKRTTENEMVGWHHQLNEHEFEWTPGVGDGQGHLACCSPLVCKESYTTEQLIWTEL